MSNCSWFVLWELQSYFGSCYLKWCHWLCRWVKHPNNFSFEMFLQQLFQHMNHNFSALTTAAIWAASLNKNMTHTNPEWNTNASMKYLFPQIHMSDYLEFLKEFYVVNALCGYPTIPPHTTTAVVRESWFSRIWCYFKSKEIDRRSTKPCGIKVAEPNYIGNFPHPHLAHPL